MSTYGFGTYGSGTYGDPSAAIALADPRLASYQVFVDWGTGTDADTSAYNDTTSDVLGSPGIVIETGRDQARAYAPPVVPQCAFDLLNEDKTYSPGSTLGPYVGRGPDVTVTSTIGAGASSEVTVDSLTVNVNDLAALVGGGTTIPLFSGHLDTVQHGLDFGQHVASCAALGQLTRLRNSAKVTTALYENLRTDQALTVILDAVGWPVGERDISVGQTVMRYWWLSNADAFEAAQQILRTEGAGAALYEDGAGVVHFEDRTYRTTVARSTTTTKVLWDTTGGGHVNVDDGHTEVDSATVYVDSGNPNSLYYLNGATIEANPDEVVTEATATVVARSEEASTQIWQSGTAFTLAPSETRDFYIAPSDPFKNAITPVVSTDYTVSAGSLTSVALDQTSGQSARLRLIASGSGASIEGPTGDEANGIQVRATPITERYTTVVRSTVDTGASTDRYTGGQPRTYDLDLWPAVSIDIAQSLVNGWVVQRQSPRDHFTLTMANSDAAHLLAIHAFAVSDRITVINQQAVLSLDAHVETLRHEITTGGLHRLTIGTEVVSSVSGVIDPPGGGGEGGSGGVPAQFGEAAPYAQFGTTHSFTS